MRLLIDECVDQRLRFLFPGHDCQTARFANLAGLKNGLLREAAEAAGFDVLITTDQNIPDQQCLVGREISLLILHGPTNRLRDLGNSMSRLTAIENCPVRSARGSSNLEQLKNGIDGDGSDLCNLSNDAVKRAYLQRVMQGNSDYVCRRSLTSQPDVASLLADYSVAEALQARINRSADTPRGSFMPLRRESVRP